MAILVELPKETQEASAKCSSTELRADWCLGATFMCLLSMPWWGKRLGQGQS